MGKKDQGTHSDTSHSYEHHAVRLTVEHLRQQKMSKERGPEFTQNFSSDVLPIESSEVSTKRAINDLTLDSSTSVEANSANVDDDKLSEVSKGS